MIVRRRPLAVCATALVAALALGCGGDDDDDTCKGGVTFAGAPADYAVPSGFPAGSFAEPSGFASCPGSGPSDTVLDVTGDGRADLVATRVCDDAAVGTSTWRVYPGGASGFGAAIDYAVPAGFPIGSFEAPAAVASCGGSGPSYTVFDLTGDGRPDLVATRVCDDAAIGTSTWRVYPGGDRGFGAAAAYGLPSGFPDGSFAAPSAVASCGGSGPSYTVFDLTGDGRPDLVATRVCDDAAVGTSRWRVYPGGASGFGAPIDYAVPSGFPTGSFDAPAAVASCGGSGPSYTVFDLTGDARPDLVATRVCDDAAVGTSTWRVYPGGASGFGAAIDYAVPAGYPVGSFEAPSAVASCGGSGPSYTVFDLTGDARPDLVATRVCDDAAVGTSTWRVYAGEAAGFAASAAAVALPAGYPTGAFASSSAIASCGSSGPSFTVFDLTGDDRPDIVATRACDDDAVGTSRWRLHASACL